MNSSNRKFFVTGAAVLVYCLTVGFGPGLLLINDAPNEGSDSRLAQASVIDPLDQPVNIIHHKDGS